MNQQSIETIGKLSKLNDEFRNEQTVKHNIIIPFLACFGHDQLELEHAPNGSRVDINIEEHRIIVETKASDKNLDDHLGQLKRYCDNESSLLAIISNGNEFRIYSPFWRRRREFRDKVIYHFQRKDLSDNQLVDRLESILSRQNLEGDKVEDLVIKRENELNEVVKKIEALEQEKQVKITNITNEIGILNKTKQELEDALKGKDKEKDEADSEHNDKLSELMKQNYLPPAAPIVMGGCNLLFPNYNETMRGETEDIEPKRTERNKIIDFDTIVVPANEDGFNSVFLGEHCWYAISISRSKLDRIKYIAGYQTAPIHAITHYAEVKSIEKLKNRNKYIVRFKDKAQKIGPIKATEPKRGVAPQGPRYTTFQKLQNAKTLNEVWT